MEFRHKSVLLDECIGNLNIKPDGVYVDGTLGDALSQSEIARRLTEGGLLVGIDQDQAAIETARNVWRNMGDRCRIVRSNYVHMDEVLRDLSIGGADGILLDLGVSSYQLDTPERGFSYMEDAPLDMRMDQRQDKTARDIVNEYTEQELYHLIRDFGEDKFAKNIARHIVKARQDRPVETTGQLVELIKAAIPARVRAQGGHPAKRTFQAIRIELNQELTVLKEALDKMAGLLNPGGRLCIITFHSLEDRIVKTKFRELEKPCTCPAGFSCMCVWQEKPGQGGDPKAHSPHRGGDGGESQV